MEYGIRFVEEYPEIGTMLERLYKKRELDDWYLKKCHEEITVPDKIYDIPHIKEIEVVESIHPSIQLIFHLDDITGSGGLHLTQKAVIKLSKLAPVYTYTFYCTVKHRALGDRVHTFEGTIPDSLSLEMMGIMRRFEEIMSENNYIDLLIDYNDTAFEWDELPHIQPINRRLLLGDALFEDVLGLCPA